MQILLQFVSKGPVDRIGLDNGLMLNRWQAIIWIQTIIVYNHNDNDTN